jgi:translation initiation factor IF-2
MSDTKSGDDKTLSVTPKKTLTLKRPGLEQGTVRQNFSHGRTKSVVVETKKRKFSIPGEKPEPSVFAPKPQAPAPEAAPAPVAPAAPAVREAPKVAPPPAPQPAERLVLNELSRDEMEARRRALQGAQSREAEERARAAEDARRRAEEEERRKREREESARRQADEQARLQAEAESRRRAEEEARRRAPAAPVADDEEEAKPVKRAGGAAAPALPPRRIATPEVARPAKAKGAASSPLPARCPPRMAMPAPARFRRCVAGRRNSSGPCIRSPAKRLCAK